MSEYEPQSNSPERPAGVASACASVGSEPASGGYQPVDTHNALSGRDLRYVLTSYIDAGYTTVRSMVGRLAADGHTVWGRASKVVSDALRWEIRNGRVVRIGRGVYGINKIPRSTRHRILARARDLYLVSARCRYEAGHDVNRRTDFYPRTRPPLARMDQNQARVGYGWRPVRQ